MKNQLRYLFQPKLGWTARMIRWENIALMAKSITVLSKFKRHLARQVFLAIQVRGTLPSIHKNLRRNLNVHIVGPRRQHDPHYACACPRQTKVEGQSREVKLVSPLAV